MTLSDKYSLNAIRSNKSFPTKNGLGIGLEINSTCASPSVAQMVVGMIYFFNNDSPLANVGVGKSLMLLPSSGYTGISNVPDGLTGGYIGIYFDNTGISLIDGLGITHGLPSNYVPNTPCVYIRTVNDLGDQFVFDYQTLPSEFVKGLSNTDYLNISCSVYNNGRSCSVKMRQSEHMMQTSLLDINLPQAFFENKIIPDRLESMVMTSTAFAGSTDVIETYIKNISFRGSESSNNIPPYLPSIPTI